MDKVKETLEKQLELLSKRSKDCSTDGELCALTSAMTDVARTLRDISPLGDLQLDNNENLAKILLNRPTDGKDQEAQERS